MRKLIFIVTIINIFCIILYLQILFYGYIAFPNSKWVGMIFLIVPPLLFVTMLSLMLVNKIRIKLNDAKVINLGYFNLILSLLLSVIVIWGILEIPK